MSQLLPCPSCARHVRQSEQGCPFCGASLALESVERAAPGRLGRAAMFAFGAAMATSVAACGGGSTPANDSGPAPLYGGPPDSSMMVDTGTPVDSGSDVDSGTDGGPVAMYGGPPVDAGDQTDTGGPAPAYGAPAIDAGGPAPAYGAAPIDAG